MGAKLNAGDQFPEITLATGDGGSIQIPGSDTSAYTIVLFYRGHW